jgi:hypothetical protein
VLGLGVVPEDGNCGKVRSSSLAGDGEDGDCTTGICGRKSKEPVLEGLSRGRLASSPDVFGLSIIGGLKSPLNVASECRCTGDNGGGLLGGRLAGLSGM